MNAVDKQLPPSKTFSGIVALLCFIAMFIILTASLVAAERQIDDLVYEATELGQRIQAQDELIVAQQELIGLYQEQNIALADLIDQAVNTLQTAVNGPYTREEIKDIVQGIADVMLEVNIMLTPAQAEEIGQAIVFNAVAAKIDPWLLLSVAITESHCRPNVRGGSGEYGMMQVMPSTGCWIAGRLGYQEFKPKDLMDLKTNIQFAAFYLRISINEFGGSIKKGTLAYNKGGAGARAWMKENPPDKNRYVCKVMNTYNTLKGG